MPRSVLFDLFETLVTESVTQPPGVSSLASGLGFEREAFRTQWKTLRPAVLTGRLSFRQALGDITTTLGNPADAATLQRLSDERARTKAQPLERVEPAVLATLDALRRRNIRLGVVSNCCAEDVAAWPTCPLATRFESVVFSYEVGRTKPDPEIYRHAAGRLGVDVSDAWYIGDGGDDELRGAAQAGLPRAFRALWFLRRWPHFRDEARSEPSVEAVDEIVSLVDATPIEPQAGRAEDER
jgi:HAD superfamily hydrolase (TIGR01509 family)